MIPPTRSSDDVGGSGAEQVPTFSQELQVPDRRLDRVWERLWRLLAAPDYLTWWEERLRRGAAAEKRWRGPRTVSGIGFILSDGRREPV